MAASRQQSEKTTTDDMQSLSPYERCLIFEARNRAETQASIDKINASAAKMDEEFNDLQREFDEFKARHKGKPMPAQSKVQSTTSSYPTEDYGLKRPGNPNLFSKPATPPVDVMHHTKPKRSCVIL